MRFNTEILVETGWFCDGFNGAKFLEGARWNSWSFNHDFTVGKNVLIFCLCHENFKKIDVDNLQENDVWIWPFLRTLLLQDIVYILVDQKYKASKVWRPIIPRICIKVYPKSKCRTNESDEVLWSLRHSCWIRQILNRWCCMINFLTLIPVFYVVMGFLIQNLS